MLQARGGLLQLPIAELDRGAVVADLAAQRAEDEISARAAPGHGGGPRAPTVAQAPVVDLFGAQLVGLPPRATSRATRAAAGPGTRAERGRQTRPLRR
eukprot:5342318-Pyramimonas_sp.AAC.1